ncbi:pH-response regulator protein palH/rim21 [Monascus purpureus]|uniref:pH-response regulator protein palH/rim21 n=2 Tax=Monascus TaxID=5097 RepID=A0A507R569_MONPU|nr:transmembrane protein PalH [Monascus ruber]TQB76020.1 pH-response regulator protein palH/rim21 [Monascus purpureus]BDD61373.1 hypothetical protein MAP00_006418 [Monascus purpureus]
MTSTITGDVAPITPRQIWATRPTTTSTPVYEQGCTPVLLPSNGYIYLNTSYTLTLSQNAVFERVCTGAPSETSHSHSSAVLDTRDPFYSSAAPQLYVIGCTTVISYLLVIILLITPRTFYVGGPGGGANFLSRHGMIARSYSGNSSVVGVGGRPWLQKVAAILVAISLTIATVDSFKVAEEQYDYGYSDAEEISQTVIDGTELRIVRVISSTFLWLAQVQTLIRLFPRHKEKIMIKWAGFALIVLDTVFSCLDNFLVRSDSTHPRLYDDAIPALSYLFELALNLLYAAWVIFYSLSKHRFAFFHPKMRNICMVALLSLCSILIPVVFFVLDIAKPGVAGWGTYVRWVGSAAASVVVWEWVERIEALERDERKDGILGREIFDGDEMLEVTPSEEVDWPRQPYGNGNNGGGGDTAMSSGRNEERKLSRRPLRARVGLQGGNRIRHAAVSGLSHTMAAHPAPPPVVATPVSRTDTTSASTVYNVRYHPVSSPSPPVIMPQMEEEEAEMDGSKEMSVISENRQVDSVNGDGLSPPHGTEDPVPVIRKDNRWLSLVNPFRKRHASPPREVAFAQAEEQATAVKQSDLSEDEVDEPRSSHPFRALNVFGQSGSGRYEPNTSLPVTVIPARRRDQQAWSPEWFEDTDRREPSLSHHPAPSRRAELPVNVIPSQPRSSAPWTRQGDEEGFDGSYELHYDPEAAALVGPGFGPCQPLDYSNNDRTRRSLTIDESSDGSGEHSSIIEAQDQGQDVEQSTTRLSSGEVGNRGSRIPGPEG